MPSLTICHVLCVQAADSVVREVALQVLVGLKAATAAVLQQAQRDAQLTGK